MATGRYAPSPTGPLHVGNLRTALLAWLFARRAGSRFVLRFEDLDEAAARPEHEAAQRADLAALGLDWDEEHRQSDDRPRYGAALERLEAAGLTYRCWCTRREIRAAAAAPHDDERPEGAYPGTCRDLPPAEIAALERSDRPAAVRLDAGGASVTFTDRLLGPYAGTVDDFVLLRNDGTPAYNLAVVVDDGAQGIEEVVRADDLLSSTPRQLHLAHLLGVTPPSYAHVPLVLGLDGRRLAKRHGAVSLGQLGQRGLGASGLLSAMAVSLGLVDRDDTVGTAAELLDRFDPAALPQVPWVFDPQ
jgi:glutamyl-tRNA synthetase